MDPRQHRWLAYGLLLPALVAVLFLIAWPLWVVFQLAFREGAGMDFFGLSARPLGFANFAAVLPEPRLWAALWHSVVYVLGSLVPGFLIGLALALLLNQAFPGRRWLRSLILLPWAVPGVIVSILFLWLLDSSYGVVNALLRQSGLIQTDIRWLTRPETAMIGVILPTVWKSFPFFALTLLAALQAIPDALYEAARVDGAGAVQRFRHITWPGIRAAAVLAAVLNGLWMFREFDIVYAATGGGPVGATETLALAVYHEAFSFFRFGTAAAMGCLMLALGCLVVLAALRPLRREFF